MQSSQKPPFVVIIWLHDLFVSPGIWPFITGLLMQILSETDTQHCRLHSRAPRTCQAFASRRIPDSRVRRQFRHFRVTGTRAPDWLITQVHDSCSNVSYCFWKIDSIFLVKFCIVFWECKKIIKWAVLLCKWTFDSIDAVIFNADHINKRLVLMQEEPVLQGPQNWRI